MLKTSKFSNQCRACRRISSDLTPLLAKLEDLDNLTIKQCIETSLGVACELSSSLPSKFCEMCLEELKTTYIFTEKYKESDLYFKRIVHNSTKQKIIEQPEPQLIIEAINPDSEEHFSIEEADEDQTVDVDDKEYIEEVDVLEGYEELVLDDHSEWLEHSEEQHIEEEEVSGNDIDSEAVFGDYEDIIVQEIDEGQFPSILSENIPVNEEEEEVLTEEYDEESVRTPKNKLSMTTTKRKMVYSVTDTNKSEEMNIMEIEHYFDEPDSTEKVSVSKRQKPLKIDDLEKKNVIPMIKTLPPVKIEGGSTVEINGETFHKCDECDKRFTKRYLLRSHIKTVHLRIREHSCTLCRKYIINLPKVFL